MCGFGASPKAKTVDTQQGRQAPSLFPPAEVSAQLFRLVRLKSLVTSNSVETKHS